jgi:shikimate kinase
VSRQPVPATRSAGDREPRRRKLICLTGFMGSGKTTVGRLLAKQIGWHFADVDSFIAQEAQLSIPEIFRRSGEPAFRRIETAVLERLVGEAAAQDRPMVVALGGGTVAQQENIELLRAAGGTLIWLDCPVETLLARCAGISDRPLFRDEASFRELHRHRLPFYAQADYRVESTAEPQRVVEQILALGVLERVQG